MSYASNPADGTRIYYEDDGGKGSPVILYGGIPDTVDLVRDSDIGRVLKSSPDEFRLIFADHRGLGKSDKPQAEKSYALHLQVGDAIAILDNLGIQRAHFVGLSYGGRLCFGIGAQATKRVLSLIIGGQQPYAINPNGPLARSVVEAVAATRAKGMTAFVDAMERGSNARLSDIQRTRYLESDPAAIAAAYDAMLTQGDIVTDLKSWQFPCLIFVGADDVDFLKQAWRAAGEIPNAEFIALEGADHLVAHLQHEIVVPAVLRTLRAAKQ